jgi:putative heme iron utilization protein
VAIKNAQSSKPRIKTLNKLKKQKEAEERNRLYRQNKDILDKDLKRYNQELAILTKTREGIIQKIKEI